MRDESGLGSQDERDSQAGINNGHSMDWSNTRAWLGGGWLLFGLQ